MYAFRVAPFLRPRRTWVMVLAVLLLVSVCLLPRAMAAFTASTTTTTATLGAVKSFYSAAVLQDSPNGYWRLGEASGAGPATDSSGNAHPGSMRDAPVLGQTGTTQDGDTSMRGQIWGQASLPRLVADDFTLEVWFKAASGNGGALLRADVNGYADDFGVDLTGSGAVHAFVGTGATSSETNIQSSGTAYNDGNWHLLDFTRVRSTGVMTLFVDGVSVVSGTGGTASLTAPSLIGLGANDNGFEGRGQTFTGSLDEAAQYTSALSATRVQAHYTARSSGYPSAVQADNPAGYWCLDDTGGRLASQVGGTAALGGTGSLVTKQVAGATGDGDTAITTANPSVDDNSRASVPRLVADDLTIEAWFRTTQVSGGSPNFFDGNVIFGSDVPFVNPDFVISISGAGKILAGVGTTNNTTDTTLTSPASYNDGQWHQVALTRVASTSALVLYVDGAAVASGTATGGSGSLNGPASLGIGSHQPNATDTPFKPLVGAVDDVSQFPSALSATRIAAHYGARTSASSYQAAVVADFPAGYWNLDDTSGTTLTATVGGTSANGYVGSSVQRGLTGVTGGQALGFARTIANTITGVTVPRTVSDDFSLECWFKTSSGGAGPLWTNGSPLIQGHVPGSTGAFGLALIYGGRVAFGADSSSSDVVESTAGYSDNAWHHVVLTRTKGTGVVALYVDGSQVSTATGSTASLTTASRLGLGTSVNLSQYLDGWLDDVAVYGSVLPASRISAHYARGH